MLYKKPWMVAEKRRSALWDWEYVFLVALKDQKYFLRCMKAWMADTGDVCNSFHLMSKISPWESKLDIENVIPKSIITTWSSGSLRLLHKVCTCWYHFVISSLLICFTVRSPLSVFSSLVKQANKHRHNLVWVSDVDRLKKFFSLLPERGFRCLFWRNAK